MNSESLTQPEQPNVKYLAFVSDRYALCSIRMIKTKDCMMACVLGLLLVVLIAPAQNALLLPRNQHVENNSRSCRRTLEPHGVSDGMESTVLCHL